MSKTFLFLLGFSVLFLISGTSAEDESSSSSSEELSGGIQRKCILPPCPTLFPWWTRTTRKFTPPIIINRKSAAINQQLFNDVAKQLKSVDQKTAQEIQKIAGIDIKKILEEVFATIFGPNFQQQSVKQELYTKITRELKSVDQKSALEVLTKTGIDIKKLLEQIFGVIFGKGRPQRKSSIVGNNDLENIQYIIDYFSNAEPTGIQRKGSKGGVKGSIFQIFFEIIGDVIRSEIGLNRKSSADLDPKTRQIFEDLAKKILILVKNQNAQS
ncbi:unnamed protein product [Caenorhabditis angaria]|uniref:SXP/RAL-2 family protein Ani s 5-like cation-binding domain-containing protein n=1 Tax=Caenorhabditis angaria TaxID=860376 RepID=A0A9P1IDA2_9PELO|nr:unnamed protein product [Caenorhabditis angaria]